MHTNEQLAAMKRTELQAAAVQAFGKQAASWTGPATNVELREALASGVPPARVATRANLPDSQQIQAELRAALAN